MADDYSKTVDSSRRESSHVVRISLRSLFLCFSVATLMAFNLGQAASPLLKRPFSFQQVESRPSTPATTTRNVAQGDGQNITNKDDKDQTYPRPTESQPQSPTGQHLLVDMEGVDGLFLDSQELLGKAISETMKQIGRRLLSWHCHGMVPCGMSCVGISRKSHITLHTWPKEGVITVDLFTSGSNNSPVPMVSVIKKQFGVAAEMQEPMVLWAHKLRGFFDPRNIIPMQSWDFGARILGKLDMEMKEEVLSKRTQHQQVDIFDTMLSPFRRVSDYRQSMSNDGSYPSQNKELYVPNRMVLLDGILQSSRYGEASYHEALVHPAMMAHENPQRVAIIGGGEGATLREVLKHQTVTTAVMVEIDKEMVKQSREHLSEWSDCSDLIGSANCCIDDERTDMYYEDAIAWFTERFYASYNSETKDLEDSDPLDVVIMDALDPEDEVVFADALYNNGIFLQSLYNALSDDGILVIQLGESDLSTAPPLILSGHKARANLIRHLEGLGFESLHVYEEAHSGFGGPWTYLVAFKSFRSRMNWYANEAEIEVVVHKRILATKSGHSALQYFDGATMVSYQTPHKSYETVFCKQEPQPEECSTFRGYDPSLKNAPISLFEVKKSGVSEAAGRGVYAKEDIVEGTCFGLEEDAKAIHFSPMTFQLVEDFKDHNVAKALDIIYSYFYGYGFQSSIRGEAEIYVDSGIKTFTNHCCNGAYNSAIFKDSDLTEMTADPENMPNYLKYGDPSNRNEVHNPVIDRHLHQYVNTGDVFRTHVSRGEEVLSNYLEYVGVLEDWEYDVFYLRGLCNGTEVGEVSSYELKSSTDA